MKIVDTTNWNNWQALDKIPEVHIGWIWIVKVCEGGEFAEDAWVAEDQAQAESKAKDRYPDSEVVSCQKHSEVTNFSMIRTLLDGRVIPI